MFLCESNTTVSPMETTPASGFCNPAMQFRIVDLPAPDAPNNTVKPFGTVNWTSSEKAGSTPSAAKKRLRKAQVKAAFSEFTAALTAIPKGSIWNGGAAQKGQPAVRSKSRATGGPSDSRPHS